MSYHMVVNGVMECCKDVPKHGMCGSLDNRYRAGTVGALFVASGPVFCSGGSVVEKRELPVIVTDVYRLLTPLDSQDRTRVVQSVMTLFGEDGKSVVNGRDQSLGNDDGELSFGTKVSRWMKQHSLSVAEIEEVFHCGDGEAEVIASDVPGNGKRGQAHNCYLLEGIRSLLLNDDPKFSDEDAVALCKRMGCHDSANHAKNRSELGSSVAGTKAGGFTLPAPGLRATGALVKGMSNGN